MPVNWKPLQPILEDNQNFVLTSHVRPDADAIGSELGMAAILEAMGKQVRIVNPSEIPDSLQFLDPEKRIMKIGVDIKPELLLDCDVHIVLDTSAWGQLGAVRDVLKKTTAVKVVIDHHVSSDDLGAIEFKDSTSEAAGALVCEMAAALNYPIPKEAASALFCAIATDTGWFRFPSTKPGTLRCIAMLMDLGVQPHALYQILYEQCSLARIRLAGRVLQRVEVDCEGRVAYTTVSQNDFSETGAKPVDTEDLVNECLRIAGVKAAFIAIEQIDKKNVKVSLRSRLDMNVAAVAEKFGGGGHQQAAGTMLSASLEDATAQVLKALHEALP